MSTHNVRQLSKPHIRLHFRSLFGWWAETRSGAFRAVSDYHEDPRELPNAMRDLITRLHGRIR